MKPDALRDAKTTQLTIGQILKRIIQVPRSLTRPSPSIVEGGLRRRARFLRTALLTAVCVFPILQITSDPIQGYPFYSTLVIFAAGIYLLSGTSHIRLASAITIVCATIIPVISISLAPVWTKGNLAFQILTWPVLSVLLGTQLISIRKQALLVGGMSSALLILTISHPGINIVDAIESIAVYFAISILLMFTSWNQECYVTRLERSNRTIEARRRELEIYNSLLRHDLGNDLQMVLGGIELSQMSNGEPRQAAFLESVHAGAQRMRSLLHIFSMKEAELETDIISVLRKIGRRSEIAFKGLHVSITSTDEVKKNPPKYGRLVALAFENLLRNAAQHAGENPNVNISISHSRDTPEIEFVDDGPGVDSDIHDCLFKKGATTSPEGKGLGLYLTRTIIESENGSIKLINPDKTGCCFLIRLPYENI
jgi:signal transduction histidine kinase